MDQPALEAPEINPETLQALASQSINHLSGLENYFIHYTIEFWLLRRLGLEPRNWSGRLVGGLFVSVVVLVPALILTAIAGQWATAPLVSWSVAALAIGALSAVGLGLYKSAISQFLFWVSALTDKEDLRRLAAWACRWYSNRVFVLASALFAVGVILPFYSLVLHDLAKPLCAGTLYIVTFIAFVVGQTVSGLILVVPEAHLLSTSRHELYRLSPADSVPVQQSLHGYNQLGVLNVLVMTAMILLLLILLPASSGVAAPVVLVMLLVEYLCTAAAVFIPRIYMGRPIRGKKWTEMKALQAQLDDFLPRVRELSEKEYEEMARLQKVHDTIRDSPENLLPLGAILRTVGALFLSTVTILVTAFAQEWIAEWAKRIIP